MDISKNQWHLGIVKFPKKGYKTKKKGQIKIYKVTKGIKLSCQKVQKSVCFLFHLLLSMLIFDQKLPNFVSLFRNFDNPYWHTLT